MIGVLSDFKSSDVVQYIQSLRDYDELLTVSLFLDKLSKIQVMPEIKRLLGQSSDSEIAEAIRRLANIAAQKREQIRADEIASAFLDKALIADFKSQFVARFRELAVIRGVLGHYNLIIPATSEQKVLYPVGIEKLMPKQAFISGQDGHFPSFAQAYAEELADFESFRILETTEEHCTKVPLNLNQLRAFAKENTGSYDIILSKDRFYIKRDFGDIVFTESWMETGAFKEIPGYLGLLHDRYRVFLVRDLPREGYVFLDSRKWGTFAQYPVLEENNAEIRGYFSFSFADLDNDEEAAALWMKTHGVTEERIKNKVGGIIYETFEFTLAENFAGTSITLV